MGRLGPEPDPYVLVSDDDILDAHSADSGDWLGVEEQQCCGDP
jgi:hypothetical protein